MDDDRVAATLLRQVRADAGLTQLALARRANIPRPVLSAYENGRRQPSVAMLSRLARVAGATVRVAAGPDPRRNAAKLLDALSLVDAMPPRTARRPPLNVPTVWRDALR